MDPCSFQVNDVGGVNSFGLLIRIPYVAFGHESKRFRTWYTKFSLGEWFAFVRSHDR
jgi:hypothetical protein